MKRFLIVTNETKDPDMILTGQIRDYIEKKGGSVTLGTTFEKKEVSANTDCVLVLGGDGTLLKTARDTAGLAYRFWELTWEPWDIWQK